MAHVSIKSYGIFGIFYLYQTLDHIEPLRGWLQDLTGNAGKVQAFAQTWANVSNQLNRVGGVDAFAG
ncbi:hypothetical protein MMX123_02745 [Microbacterium sp. MM2322]|uniref:hypothetical protein n=1 Tax=Microbacterium sp. MM2322 TaxID=3157631 RepID=UPI003D8063D5